MLLGQYVGTLTNKQQISLPSKFRQVLGERIIITKGFESCLVVVSESMWKTLLEGTEGRPFIDKSAREIQRFLLGNATFVELDSKGRCVLPSYLREYALITNEIVFAGISRFVEVWDKKKWEEQQDLLSANAVNIAESLSREGKNE